MSWHEGFGCVVVAILSIVLWYAFSIKTKYRKVPVKWQEIGQLKSIHFYPLKSGAKLHVNDAYCADVGLKQIGDGSKILLSDRCFMIYDAKHKEFRSARQWPKILLIKLTPHDKDTVSLEAPDMDTLYVKVPTGVLEKTFVTMLAGERVETTDCGDNVGHWLSRFILKQDFGLRLGYNDGTLRRNLTKNWSDLMKHDKLLSNKAVGLYSKLVSVSAMNQASLDDCNAKLNGAVVVNADNFRHNLLIDGPGLKPYDEDYWDFIRIGNEVVLRKVKDCLRCNIPALDPVTAIANAGWEPIKTLKTYRQGLEGPEKGNPKMGIYCEVRSTGHLKVGDTVYISTL